MLRRSTTHTTITMMKKTMEIQEMPSQLLHHFLRLSKDSPYLKWSGTYLSRSKTLSTP